MIRRTLAIGTLTVGLLVAGTGVAAAHECYIPNRSEKGNAGASHSKNWETLHLSMLFATAHEELWGEPLSETEIAEATAMAVEAGVPSSVTIFTHRMLPGSIKEGDEPTPKSWDGKGVDHFFTTYVGTLIEVWSEFREPPQE